MDIQKDLPPSKSSMPTRARSSKEKENLILNPNSAVNSAEEGRQLLLQDGMIIKDTVMDKQALATTLLYIALESSKTSRSVVDHIRAVAFLLINDDSTKTARTITSKTLDILEEPINRLTESTKGWTKIAEQVVKLQNEEIVP